MKKSIVSILMLSVALLATAMVTQAEADLIVNGNFQTYNNAPIGNSNSSFITLSAGSSALTGWTISGDSVDYIGGYWQNPGSSLSIDLSGNAPGAISQYIATTNGQQYQLTFQAAGNPDGPPDPKNLQVTIGSSAYLYSPVTGTKDNMGYGTYSILFTATSNSTDVIFATAGGAINNTPFGPVVGDIHATATPIPAAAWLFGSGLLGLFGIKRKVDKA